MKINLKTNRFLFAAFVVLGLSLFAACATGSARYNNLGAAGDPVPFLADIRTGQLENGLRYFILENAKPENRAFLSLAVKTGSVYEEEDERGLAHFVEHMAFNGTERFPETQLIEYLRSLGTRFGADANAYTSYNETVYSIESPTEIVTTATIDGSGKKVIPENALAILDDWSRAVLFTEKDVDEERAIIMEEYRARLNVWDRIMQQLTPVIFHDSQYKDRRIIGLPEIIENAPASRLKAFYDKWYRPENMALVIVGDFDGEEIERNLAAHFTAKPRDDVFSRPVYDLPPPEKGRFEAKIITDSENGPANILIYMKRDPKTQAADIASYRNELAETLAYQILNTRYAELLEDPETPFTGAYGITMPYGESSRFALIMATAKEGRTKEALRAVLTGKEQALRDGFTASEVDRAKAEIAASFDQALAEKDKMESTDFEREILSYYLEGGTLAGIAWEAAAVQALLPGITAKDLKAAFNKMLSFDDTAIIIAANDNERASLPDEAGIKAIAREAKNARPAKPEARRETGALLAKTPQPGMITDKQYDAASGTTRFQLSNGAKVIVKPTQNKNDEIILQALARGGFANAPEEHIVSAELATALFEVSGAGTYSANDLARLLAGKNVSARFSTGSFSRSFSGYSSAKDLKTFFELIHLLWTAPRFDEKAVQAYLDRLRTSLAQNRDNPDVYFGNELAKAIYTENPWFMPIEPEDLAKINTEAAHDFVRRYRNPADWTFVFTGNIDIESETDTFAAYLEQYLASIPAPADGDRLDTFAGITVTRPEPAQKTIRKGKENRSTVFAGYYARAAFSEKEAVAAYIFNEYMDIHFNDVLREQRGGVYSISAEANLSPLPLPGELSLNIYFYCDPARAAELQQTIHAELAKIAAGDISPDIFAKAKAAQIKVWEDSMQDNDYIASRYANYTVIFDLPLAQLRERGNTLNAATPAEIQAIARKLAAAGAFVLLMNPE
ncbi:MAG: insulinase family protein [Spirochaetaceae bacterium]|jgi:zinc protease|nr:insulinase family protein [Spirochaetaceae bacterium]